jgi:hypothetical protein
MLNWFRNFCNISVYLFYVTHLPEDGHVSGRNIKEALLHLQYIFLKLCEFVGCSRHIQDN